MRGRIVEVHTILNSLLNHSDDVKKTPSGHSTHARDKLRTNVSLRSDARIARCLQAVTKKYKREGSTCLKWFIYYWARTYALSASRELGETMHRPVASGIRNGAGARGVS